MRLVIGVPSPEFINAYFALVNLQEIISKSKSHVDEVFLATQSGVRTDKNRNIIVQKALDNDADAILWLDSDMIFPTSIVEIYLRHEFDIMGCLYFKRTKPYSPIAYVKNPDKSDGAKPYFNLDPSILPENEILEVDALGYGGMMVKMDVYRGMGEDKWTHYGENFHLPYKAEESMTHDIVFCRDAKKHGFSIKLHTGVKPGHISQYPITQADWERSKGEKVEID